MFSHQQRLLTMMLFFSLFCLSFCPPSVWAAAEQFEKFETAPESVQKIISKNLQVQARKATYLQDFNLECEDFETMVRQRLIFLEEDQKFEPLYDQLSLLFVREKRFAEHWPKNLAQNPPYLEVRVLLQQFIRKWGDDFSQPTHIRMLAMNIMDRYYNHYRANKTYVQLIAWCAFALAVKMNGVEADFPPSLVNFPENTKWSADFFKAAEIGILKALDFQTHVILPLDFIETFAAIIQPNESLRGALLSSTKVFLFEVVQHLEFYQFPPSLIASAAIYTTLKEWSELAQQLSGYQVEDLNRFLESIQEAKAPKPQIMEDYFKLPPFDAHRYKFVLESEDKFSVRKL